MIGRIVCSKAGRDKGMFMVVLGDKEGKLLVAEGKERPVENPKHKNPKHLMFTNTYLEVKQYSTNKSLRRALREYRNVAEQEED